MKIKTLQEFVSPDYPKFEKDKEYVIIKESDAETFISRGLAEKIEKQKKEKAKKKESIEKVEEKSENN